MKRCDWATKSPQLMDYHDTKWGVPDYDEQSLFRDLSLEIMQAGLQWNLILKKLDGLDDIYHQFDFGYLAYHFEEVRRRALNDVRGIRNRSKIEAILTNAQIMAELEAQNIHFFDQLWQLVNYTPIDHLVSNDQVNLDEMKPMMEKFKRMFQKYHFKRVGPMTLYSFLQASGIVNDHDVECFRHDEILKYRGR